MPTPKFTPGSTRAVMFGRAGALRRWSRRTSEQRAEEMAKVRQGLLNKPREEAKSILGGGATPEAIEQMATDLLRAERVRRAARATDARVRKPTPRLPEQMWIDHAASAATKMVDKILGELPFPPEPASVQSLADWRAGIAKTVYGALTDELQRPHAERDFQRMRTRWEEYRKYLHSTVCPTQAPGICLYCKAEGVA